MAGPRFYRWLEARWMAQFWFITALERLGLAREVRLPDSAPAREGLVRVEGRAAL